MQFIFFFFTGKCRFSWEYQQNKSVIHFWCSLSDSMKDWMDFSLKDWRIKHQLLDPNLTYVGTNPYDHMICLCFARTVEHKHPWESINKASALLTNTKHCGRNMFFLFLHLVTEVFKKQQKKSWDIDQSPWCPDGPLKTNQKEELSKRICLMMTWEMQSCISHLSRCFESNFDIDLFSLLFEWKRSTEAAPAY